MSVWFATEIDSSQLLEDGDGVMMIIMIMVVMAVVVMMMMIAVGLNGSDL